MPDDAPLEATLSEEIKTSDTTVKVQLIPVQGVVAVLDALGTKLSSVDEAVRFVQLRDSILTSTTDVVETHLPGIDTKRLKIFTFNDTIVYVYKTPATATLAEVEVFCHVLRIFETRAMVEGTFFRGALAIGEFFIGNAQTVLGPAIYDAAAWFEQADWIGIHATPHATMHVESLLESSGRKIDHVLVDYDVPLRDKTTVRAKALNWPKGFYMKNLRPPGKGRTRGLVLAALTKHRVPKETETKYFHTIDFFDQVEKKQKLDSRAKVD
jgi:hypothetical protein